MGGVFGVDNQIALEKTATLAIAGPLEVALELAVLAFVLVHISRTHSQEKGSLAYSGAVNGRRKPTGETATSRLTPAVRQAVERFYFWYFASASSFSTASSRASVTTPTNL